MTRHLNFTPVAQVDPEAYNIRYDNARRWTSYWIQLENAAQFASNGPLLEIGIGNGLITSYLRHVVGADVLTVDIDARLRPDVVADISELPFDDRAFECVIACEVLEHMPFDISKQAILELRRVAKHAIVSVPNADRRFLQLFVSLGSRRRRVLKVDISRFLPGARNVRGTSNHYWELNYGGLTPSEFIRTLSETGWSVRKQFRNPDFPYHHFFVLD